ncbi:MAG: carboxypeptidase-like regulatory domain-containing protein, partial [Bacteroidota bacterium]
MRYLLIFFACCLLGNVLIAQESYILEIRTVSEETNTALAFVNLQIEGTDLGGTSDENGNWRVRVPAGKTVVLASFIGYEDEKATVDISGDTR